MVVEIPVVGPYRVAIVVRVDIVLVLLVDEEVLSELSVDEVDREVLEDEVIEIVDGSSPDLVIGTLPVTELCSAMPVSISDGAPSETSYI